VSLFATRYKLVGKMKLNMKMTISKRFVNTIAVAMSGGIDSSVTALLLKQKVKGLQS